MSLTAREREALVLVAEGRTARAAARVMGVAPRTVDKHLENTYRKLCATNRVDAVLTAQRLGILDVSPAA